MNVSDSAISKCSASLRILGELLKNETLAAEKHAKTSSSDIPGTSLVIFINPIDIFLMFFDKISRYKSFVAESEKIPMYESHGG